MIERGDAIKRPVDSTLATREVHRGVSGMPVAQADVLAQVRQQSPVLAVVVEQTVLGNTQKPLFDLLLKVNDQWLQARTEQGFKPGTVLMIEAGHGPQLLVLTRPDATQLQQMMQASLSFWQAHTLPRVHPTQLPPVPAPTVLNNLAQQHPNLAPLIEWLTQRSTADSANLMRWVASFQPLGADRLPVPGGQPRAQPGLAGTPFMPSATPGTATASNAMAASAQQSAQTATPVFTPPPLPSAQPMTQAISNANAPLEANTAMKPDVTRVYHQTPLSLKGNARIVAQSNVLTPPLPAGAQQFFNLTPTGATLLPIEPAKQSDMSAAMLTGIQGTARSEPASNPTALLWRDLASPAGASTRSTENIPLPIEIRLGQWLTQIDQNVRHQPATLQEALAIKAQQLLNANTARPTQQTPYTQAQQPGTAPRLETQEPLLQLRQFLEGVQAKVQNNAIQQSFSTLTQPDMPQVQQLSIPLIWLGVTAWANLEWWQEKRERKDGHDKRSGDRLWRFRLFLELKPLAPFCADLSWHNHEAQVIFWSQDPGTLNVLNQHLDQLNAWTEGLGERQFTTRHGMPPKKTTPRSDDFRPLVDVRT